ncbi:MAG: DUF4159 domain-containing protein [Planctomycetota bacterium]|nr:DUF4159 domain-containing protein [Planctomycetota bacterium]
MPPQQVAPQLAPVRPAMIVHGSEQRRAICFSTGFLELLARETTIAVEPAFTEVALGSPALRDHPFAVLSGEGAFELSDHEVAALRSYVEGGGFLLASAGCSDDAWAASMERALERAFPRERLVELTLEHPLFHTLFDITELASRRRQPVRILGLETEGRLAVIYSPQGLNDTRDTRTPAPGECCCCGGDEITAAKYINASALAYALLR